jgi:hypothetical protein
MVLHGRTCGQRAACSTGRPGTAGRSPALPHGFTCWASLDRCPLFSVSASVPTPQLIGSGLSIITHDDLYDSLITRRATSIGTSTRPTTQSQLRIASLWQTCCGTQASTRQTSSTFRCLDRGKIFHKVSVYWAKPMGTRTRRIYYETNSLRYPALATFLQKKQKHTGPRATTGRIAGQ